MTFRLLSEWKWKGCTVFQAEGTRQARAICVGDCSHEIKILTPWKESYDQPRYYIQKQRHYFATKVHLVKATVFPVVMYGCESWTVKKAECRRIDASELWC